MRYKVKKVLQEKEKNSYASDVLVLPKNGIDCSEGCNPYGFPKAVLNMEYDFNRLSTYPHSQAPYDAIIEYWRGNVNLEKENILLADGSISAIYTVNNIFAEAGAKVLGYAPQFTDYVANVEFLGMTYTSIKLLPENNYKLITQDVIDRLSEDLSVVYLDNPNNPTGQVIPLDEIEEIIIAARALDICVIVDEAYGDFITREESATILLEKYENLIVLKTLSKGFGLAGVRAGFVLASKPLIAYMKKTTNPYVLGDFSRELVASVLRSENQLEENILNFAKIKNAIIDLNLKNITIAETDPRVPICLIIHKDEEVDLVKALFNRGILAVPGAEFEGLSKNSARLRMPKIENMNRFLEAIKSL
ncbi:MAG: aminotransferase class I/II-fold pyridoxal phosphate-dependent enzyme [Anaerovoracaceae bacterium]